MIQSDLDNFLRLKFLRGRDEFQTQAKLSID